VRPIRFVIALALLTAGAARADVRVFANESAFVQAAPQLSRQNFESLPDLHIPNTIEIAKVQYGTRGRWDVPGGCTTNRELGASTISSRRISFVTAGGAPGTVRAFGLRLTTFAVSPPADFAAIVMTKDGAQKQVPIDDVVNSDPVFRGFISTSPIVSVLVTPVGTTLSNFCFDDVSHSEVDALD
jgi:hypothetical protein